MLWTLLALAVVGFGAGTVGALLGLGGGILLVPALTILFGLPIRVAVGASLICVIATSAGVTSVSRPGRGADFGLALRLEIATTIGAILGSLLAGYLSGQALSILFAAIVLATAYYTYSKARRKTGPATDGAVEALFRTDYQPTRWPIGLGMTGVAGARLGLTGTGGGFIKVPVMYSIMNVPLGVATASSNFMVGITAAASAFVYFGRGDVYPLVAVPTAWGCGGGVGGRAGRQRPAARLSGLTGTGGGFIKVPVMYSIMNVPLGVATASSNFMVGITAAASAFVYFGRGDVYPLVAVPTALGVFTGAIAGARLAPTCGPTDCAWH